MTKVKHESLKHASPPAVRDLSNLNLHVKSSNYVMGNLNKMFAEVKSLYALKFAFAVSLLLIKKLQMKVFCRPT